MSSGLRDSSVDAFVSIERLGARAMSATIESIVTGCSVFGAPREDLQVFEDPSTAICPQKREVTGPAPAQSSLNFVFRCGREFSGFMKSYSFH